ncbi:MAG: hypothetical protein JNJ46_33170 [Myxococcales bacterium]|nr:hypothetical protein [Myxococcales bacterium]
MCDTAVWVTASGVFFAKNSDRDLNEAQHLDAQPAREYKADSLVRCSQQVIPQARRTHAVLLSRPYWSWGAEIATNEHGVTVGNEAVFTHMQVPRQGLSGMDLVRLAVERGETADEAVAVLSGLLSRHAQGGLCGHENPGFRYFSSFLVADRKTAFVVETCGPEIAHERVPVGTGYAISNGLSLAHRMARHENALYRWASRCRLRRARTRMHLDRLTAPQGGMLDRAAADATLRSLMAMLRDHGEPEGDDPGTIRYDRLFGGLAAPCVHAGGMLAASQTTASWVAQLGGAGGDRHFVTATAAPCTGLFKPVAVTAPLPGALVGTQPSDGVETVGPPSLFWQHERLHRAVLRDPARLLALYRDERDALEARFVTESTPQEEAFSLGWQRLAEWTLRVERALGAQDAQRGRRHSTLPGWVERYLQNRSERAGLIPGRRKSHRPPYREPGPL